MGLFGPSASDIEKAAENQVRELFSELEAAREVLARWESFFNVTTTAADWKEKLGQAITDLEKLNFANALRECKSVEATARKLVEYVLPSQREDEQREVREAREIESILFNDLARQLPGSVEYLKSILRYLDKGRFSPDYVKQGFHAVFTGHRHLVDKILGMVKQVFILQNKFARKLAQIS